MTGLDTAPQGGTPATADDGRAGEAMFWGVWSSTALPPGEAPVYLHTARGGRARVSLDSPGFYTLTPQAGGLAPMRAASWREIKAALAVEAPRWPSPSTPVAVAAAHYAARGWRPFPLLPFRLDGSAAVCACIRWRARKGDTSPCDRVGKHPAGKGWSTAPPPSPVEALATWGKASAGGIGVVTGPGLDGAPGLALIDLDGPEGEASWLALLGELGLVEPVTLTATTGRAEGGRHLLFALPPGLDFRNGAGLMPGLDVRGAGGFFVAPPSPHKSGRGYMWRDPGAPLATLPPALQAWLDVDARRARRAEAREGAEAHNLSLPLGGWTPPPLPGGTAERPPFRVQLAAPLPLQAELPPPGLDDAAPLPFLDSPPPPGSALASPDLGAALSRLAASGGVSSPGGSRPQAAPVILPRRPPPGVTLPSSPPSSSPGGASPPPPAHISSAGAGEVDRAARLAAWGRAVLDGEAAAAAAAPGGARNVTLYASALRAFRVQLAADGEQAPGGVTWGEVAARLAAAGAVAGLDRGEVARTVQSAGEAARREGPAEVPAPPPLRRAPAPPRRAPRDPDTPASWRGGELDDTPPEWPPAWLPSGSQAAGAGALLNWLEDARGQVAAEGGLYVCDGGVWRPLDAPYISSLLQELDGVDVGKARLGKGGLEMPPKSLQVSSAWVDGVRQLAVDRVTASAPLPQPRGGVAFRDGVFLPLDAASLGRAGHPGPLRWGELARAIDPGDGVRWTVDLDSSAVIASLERTQAGGGWRVSPWGEGLAAVFPSLSEGEALGELIGASLAGVATVYQRAGLLLGDGGAGKSSLLEIITALFPEGVARLHPGQWADGTLSQDLRTMRLNVVAELPQADLLSSEVFKAVVTGDPITRRGVWERRPVTFSPVSGHLFSANTLPGAYDASWGFWRRWLILPTRGIIDPAKAKPGYARLVLSRHLEDVAAWAVEGAARLAAQGRFTACVSHDEHLEEWQDFGEPVRAWWRSPQGAAEQGPPGDQVPALRLYEAFCEWAAPRNYARISIATFSGRLKAAGAAWKRKAGGTFYTLPT